MTEDGYVPVDSRDARDRVPRRLRGRRRRHGGRAEGRRVRRGRGAGRRRGADRAIRSGGEHRRLRGPGSCYIEFGAGRIGRVDVDFLSGPEADRHLPRARPASSRREAGLRLQPPRALVRPLARLAAGSASGGAAAVGCTKSFGADQREAERGADEGDDRRDQEDLVEAADEGRVGGVERLRRGIAAESFVRRRASRPRRRVRRGRAVRAAAIRRASSRPATGRPRRGRRPRSRSRPGGRSC